MKKTKWTFWPTQYLLLSTIFPTCEFTLFNFETMISFHCKESYFAFERLENMTHITCSLVKRWRMERIGPWSSNSCLS